MMSWDYPYRFGGPVLAWELHQGRKQLRLRILAYCFFALFVANFAFSAMEFEKRSTQPVDHYQNWQAWLQNQNEAKLVFTAQFLGKFFPAQLLVLLLITPVLTAGALGQEKENDTLIALFGTELADYEIVRGKVLGRFWMLVSFMFISMPLPLTLAGFAQVSLLDVLLCYLHAFVITFALTGICIFSAVITRRTRDAIMACYSIIIIITLISLTVLGDQPLPTWLNPAEVVIGLSAYPFTNIKPYTLFVHLFFFWFMGWFFVKLSCWLIRWAGLRQLEDRSMRWRWGVRTNIGSDPIRWRERHILGVAPLPALRMIPTWLGALGCLAFSVSMILGIVNNLTHGRMLYFTFRGEWGSLFDLFMRINYHSILGEVILMGIILIIFAGGTIFFRCAGAIIEEKRMKTWDDLVMTGTPISQMARSKMWGILQASLLFVLCYTIPFVAFSVLGRESSIVAAVITVGITWVVMYGAAEIGIAISLSSAEKEVVRRR